MIELPVSDEVLIKARKLAADMGSLKGSIQRGDGNIYGFIGELLHLQHYGGTHDNTYEWDIVDPDGTKVDVKTKKTSVKPLPHYECSVTKSEKMQDCDAYSFVRVKNDLTVGWLLGTMSKDKYIKDAVHMEKGDVDPSNGWICKRECYNMAISNL